MLILRIKRNNFKKILKIASFFLEEGKVIVSPTDTVYGMICDARNKKTVEKVFKIKKRPKGKPLPIFIKDIKIAKEFAVINKKQEKFLKKVWPGKTTVRLKRTRLRTIFTSALARQRKTIALRIPNYRLINIILEKMNLPLVGTSANISGKPASIKIKEVREQLENQKYKPDLILDAGNLKPSKPSKVIDLTCKTPKILRE